MKLRSIPAATLILAALVFALLSGGRANAATDAGASVKPSRVFTVGTLRVERYGAGSPAMVFIPGLSCGSWVWADAVKTYASAHTVYLVTLAGFDGLPAPASPAIDGADASLLQLLSGEKLVRPIIVGHSLGGFLALRFGTEHPELIRGLVSVDGTPVFPPLAQSTAEQRAAAADSVAAQMRSATPAQFVTSQNQTLATMITSADDVKRIAPLAARSDPKAVAAYADELFRADLRPELPKLTVPTLEIAPVPTMPAAYEGPQAATASMADRQAGYKAFYGSLFTGAPKLTIVTVPNSKHFVMVDQPAALFDAISGFIATLPG